MRDPVSLEKNSRAKLKVLLVQPPVQDFYDTDVRLQPIGLAYLKAAVKKHLPHVEISIKTTTAAAVEGRSPFRMCLATWWITIRWPTSHPFRRFISTITSVNLSMRSNARSPSSLRT